MGTFHVERPGGPQAPGGDPLEASLGGVNHLVRPSAGVLGGCQTPRMPDASQAPVFHAAPGRQTPRPRRRPGKAARRRCQSPRWWRSCPPCWRAPAPEGARGHLGTSFPGPFRVSPRAGGVQPALGAGARAWASERPGAAPPRCLARCPSRGVRHLEKGLQRSDFRVFHVEPGPGEPGKCRPRNKGSGFSWRVVAENRVLRGHRDVSRVASKQQNRRTPALPRPAAPL
jgi:hypothetical protein